MPARDLGFVFVCQRGEIEVKALLLAASLRDAMGAACRIVAVVPEMYGRVRAPGLATLRALRALDVTLVHATNPHCVAGDAERVGDGHMNKAAALARAAATPRTMLLDSDVLCFGPPAPPRDAPFVAKPVDLEHAVPWPALYELVDLPLPCETVRPTVGGAPQPPYFNSGVLVVDTTTAPRLAACWDETFARVTASGLMDHAPFFREQVSLALAVQRLRLAWRLLDERHNWPVHLKALDATPPLLAHYHGGDVLRRTTVLRERLGGLARRWPQLAPALARHDGWDDLLD